MFSASGLLRRFGPARESSGRATRPPRRAVAPSSLSSTLLRSPTPSSFESCAPAARSGGQRRAHEAQRDARGAEHDRRAGEENSGEASPARDQPERGPGDAQRQVEAGGVSAHGGAAVLKSEERRVGEEGRTRRAPYH